MPQWCPGDLEADREGVWRPALQYNGVASLLTGVSMSTLSTPDLADAAPEVRALELQFINVGQVKQFHGQVVTIKCHEDNSLVKQTVAEPGRGRVIVVDGGGSQ